MGLYYEGRAARFVFCIPILNICTTIGINMIKIRRKTREERRFNPSMGLLHTRVTYIQKTLAGIPFKTLHAYRGTYYGEVKDCKDCELAL